MRGEGSDEAGDAVAVAREVERVTRSAPVADTPGRPHGSIASERAGAPKGAMRRPRLASGQRPVAGGTLHGDRDTLARWLVRPIPSVSPICTPAEPPSVFRGLGNRESFHGLGIHEPTGPHRERGLPEMRAPAARVHRADGDRSSRAPVHISGESNTLALHEPSHRSQPLTMQCNRSRARDESINPSGGEATGRPTVRGGARRPTHLPPTER